MADVIYCHQCARDNVPSRKFCLKCSSSLLLIGNPGDQARVCRNCHHANPSFARFCVQCSTPVIANPPKSPDSSLPIALRNSRAVGSDACPACGRPAPDLVSNYVRQKKLQNRSNEIRDNAGFVYGTVGTHVRIESGMKEPRSGFPTGLPQTLFTGGLGCALSLLLPAIVLMILPTLRANSLLLLIVAVPVGFFLANRLYRRLLGPYMSQLELARARWRQARICLRCDAAFVPQEGIYVSPEFLDRLVWHSPSKS